MRLSREPIWLEADVTRLAQVVGNLLNNAAKYTQENGRIELIVDKDGAEAVLRVRDDGVGIAPQLLPHIFELFTQGDRTLARSEGGLGIGLTVVQRLVEMHGGCVSAASDGVGRGSEFVVRLPAPAPGGEVASPQPSAEPGSDARAARRILVVDDNSDAAETTALLLASAGHDVRVAQDGSQALALAMEFSPEIVFLDIGLPRMDGYEVARRLRQLAGLQQILLIAVTGYGRDEDRRRSEAAGFNYHLVKPVRPELLDDLIGRMRTGSQDER